MPKKTAPDVLTGHAKEIFESVYESAWKGWKDADTDKTQEGYAAAVAWSAVKKQYKKEGDSWVKKSLAQNMSFGLRITKARHDAETGKIRWHAQAANDEIDCNHEEALDPSLFTDFAENFQAVMVAYATGQEPPDFGHGAAQIPILDVSHYSALLPLDKRNEARVGSITKLYRDGRYLHADGYFDDTDIGHMAAKSILADEDGVLRTSVGFWADWGNIEVRNDVLTFRGGRRRAYLDHIAITSVPRIPTTTIDAEMGEVTMSKAKTMAEDALAVLGDESVVEGLEQLVEDGVPVTESMVLRSEDVVEEETEVVETESDVVETDVVEEAAEVESDVVEVEAVEEESVELESDVVETDIEEPVDEVVVEELVEEMQTEAEVVVDLEVMQLPYGGATSFEGAIEYQQAIDEKWRVEDGWWLLRTVIDNIMSSDVEDPKAAIASALSQYTAFLESGESLMSEVAEAEKLVAESEVVEEPVEEPVVECPVGELAGAVEDIATVSVPVGPPEAQAMSMVTVEESLGRNAVTSFGEALDKLGKMNVPVPSKQAAVRELSQIAEDTIQRELVSDADVSDLVQEAVGQAMSSVEAELAQIRELLTKQSVPGSQGQTPQRPGRKSHKPNIQPAKVTTRAQTFSDVIDRLIS